MISRSLSGTGYDEASFSRVISWSPSVTVQASSAVRLERGRSYGLETVFKSQVAVKSSTGARVFDEDEPAHRCVDATYVG